MFSVISPIADDRRCDGGIVSLVLQVSLVGAEGGNAKVVDVGLRGCAEVFLPGLVVRHLLAEGKGIAEAGENGTAVAGLPRSFAVLGLVANVPAELGMVRSAGSLDLLVREQVVLRVEEGESLREGVEESEAQELDEAEHHDGSQGGKDDSPRHEPDASATVTSSGR